MTPPLLVIGWGNRSRGDDALGPLLVDQLHEQLGAASGAAGPRRVEFLEDYQLQVEHALDLVGRAHVLFADASRACAAPFEVTPLQPARDESITTHAVSPAAVMQVFRDLYHVEPPACSLLAIRGESFELGEAPSAQAERHLALAVDWARRWVETRTP